MDKSALNPLIDADAFVYDCGFAADTQAVERWGSDGYQQEDYKNWALHNVDTKLDFLLSETFPKCEWYQVFVGGNNNYRDTICKALPIVHEGWKYKGNRDPLHKPKYYAEIREHLIQKWGAQLVHGREADDEVSIIQYSHPDRSTCIVAVDKDLDNSCGWRFNPKKGKRVFTYTTLKTANFNFWKQVASGDSTDNIKGLHRVGVKTAAQWLEDCDFNVERYRRLLVQKYEGQYGKYGKQVFEDTCHLVWIQRERDVLYDGRKLEIV